MPTQDHHSTFELHVAVPAAAERPVMFDQNRERTGNSPFAIRVGARLELTEKTSPGPGEFSWASR